ncbi:hypothetical protein BN439_2515 [Erwinia amylovora Ea644]|nr:hypothetical protein BN439_2515 [Erwinia amylovora Ea644]CCP07598.1 hypothetical protein BN440_2579 [Erwinia amylovora MR1]
MVALPLGIAFAGESLTKRKWLAPGITVPALML